MIRFISRLDGCENVDISGMDETYNGDEKYVAVI